MASDVIDEGELHPEKIQQVLSALGVMKLGESQQ